MTIYKDLEQLEALIEACADPETGEIKESDDEAYQSLKKELLENGLERLAKVRANKLARVDGLKSEIDRLTRAKKREENAIEWLENYMLFLYDQSPKDARGKVMAGTFTIGTRKSSAVEIDEAVFSDPMGRFTKTEIKIDKSALKEALKTEEIAGAKIVERVNLAVK